jgi:hypothetical protein
MLIQYLHRSLTGQSFFFERPSQSLTIASFVGNTMATYVMQSLGCEVAGINTVHFSETLNTLDNMFTYQ